MSIFRSLRDSILWRTDNKMKNKKWKLSALIVLGIIIFLVVSFFIFAFVMNEKGCGMTVGRALYAKDGTCMLVEDENSPIRMSDLSKGGNLFEGISTGDKILVIHTGIAESYPAQTGAYWLIKIGEGSRDDIPDKIIDELTAMGWLSHVYSDKYSFSLRFGIYGERFYDSASGKLVKVASKPQKDQAEFFMSEEDFDTVLNMIWAMDISSYPSKYDPINPPDAEEKLVSNPYETIVFTYRTENYETTITCEEVALGGGGYDEKSRAFLELCDYIERIVVNSEEWKALPAPEVIHE